VTTASPISADVAGIRTIAPAKRRLRLRDVIATWPITRVVAARDLTLRHKQSVLGPLWNLIQPLGMLAAFAFIFDGVAQVDTSGIPYGLFALVGVTVYGFLQLTLMFGVRTHLSSYRLIKRVACPRLALINGSLIASLVQPAMMLALTFVAIVLTGHDLTLNAFALPLCIAWLVLFMWTVMLVLPTLNVRWRDISQLTPLALQGGIFLSPVGYPLSEAPDSLEWLLVINPVSGLIEAWRWCLLGAPVDLLPILVAVGWTLALGIGGWQLFVRWEIKFADII
jgi:lipopolysaccharide transport system permease protein